MRTTTLFICVVSIIVLGGTTNMALQILGIKTGASQIVSMTPQSNTPRVDEYEEDEENDSSDSSDDDEYDTRNSFRNSYSSNDRAESQSGSQHPHWFVNFDQSYLKPIFSK